MGFLPAQDFVLDVPAAPEEVAERLRRAVAKRRGVSVGKPATPFSGTVGMASFELRPVLGYRNSFAPVVRGTFSSGLDGTRVDVHLRLARAVSAFMTVWLGFAATLLAVGIVVAIADPSRPWLALAALGLLALGYGITWAAFRYESSHIRTNLVRLLVEGDDAGELPRLDLSWLSDVRLRDAEPPERRFNVLFLVSYGVSAALALLAWERIASACTNPQYRRPDVYSCPSGTRIFLTWCLLAALVTAGLASRFALHRRARRTYPLLLAIVVAIGATAAWLLTHHPRCGVR